MKHFLLLIFLLSPLILHAEEAPFTKASSDSPAWAKVIHAADSFIEQGREKITSLHQQTPQEVQRTKFHPLAFLFWDEKGISPLTGLDGQGEKIDTPFGFVQLLSALTGTEGQKQIPLTLNVSIRNDWKISHPIATIQQQKNIHNFSFFESILPPFEKDKPYINNVAFPILIDVTPSKNVILKLNFQTTACYQRACQNVSIIVPIELKASTGYISPYRSYINKAFQAIPKSVSNKQLNAFIAPDRTLHIEANMEDTIKTVQFFIDTQIPFTQKINDFFIEKNKAVIRLETMPSLKSENVRILFHSGNQFVQNNITIQDGTPSLFISPPSKPPTFGISTFLTLSFFSPLLILLLTFNAPNDKTAQRQAIQTVPWLFFIPLGISIVFMCYPVPFGTWYSPFWMITCGMIFITAYFYPIAITPLTCTILTIIAPLNYIAPLWNKALHHPFDFALLGGGLGLFVCIPYLIILIHPHWGVWLAFFNQKIKKPYIKLPLLISAFWFLLMIISTGLNTLIDIPLSSRETIQKNIHNNKIALELSGPQWCVTCTIAKANMRFIGVSKNLISKQELFLYANVHHLIYPQSTLYTSTFPNGKTVPAFIEDYEMSDFFKHYPAYSNKTQ